MNHHTHFWAPGKNERPAGAACGPVSFEQPVATDWQYVTCPDCLRQQPVTAENLGGLYEDPVNLPSHYTQLPVECIDITEHFNFTLGNAIKYIWRADHKGKPIEDLRKAVWYLEREIARRESA